MEETQHVPHNLSTAAVFKGKVVAVTASYRHISRQWCHGWVGAPSLVLQVGTRGRAVGAVNDGVLCEALMISSGELLPAKFFFTYVMCPAHRERQKIVLLSILIS